MDTEKKLNFFLKKYGVYSFELPIFNQMELIGMDADIFLEEFSTQFNVNISDFVYEDFFNNVSNIPFAYLFKKPPKYDCTYEHILDVINKGVWYYPPYQR